MKTRSNVLLVAAMVLAGCSHDDGRAAAIATVDALQTAMRAGDAAGCRRLVTDASVAAVACFPWRELRQRQRVEILGAAWQDAGCRVEVTDPNDGDRRGAFVVVREYGRYKVDLVATAGLTATFVEGQGAREVLEPRELTPADHDRIRLHELAQPPR